MPYLHMKEIWTPLRFFCIFLYKCIDNGSFYFRIGMGKLTRIF
ncbi:hypothetical protein LX24_02982 [Desulfallas thermosapovorans DSM 6562]|uniref:Uncharacterized protein n=1 Tax=Desulfallas thermosapovorans DSM 6562 TaxID=1121431 RepID=A0A5S4ZMV0_9FIRM|nr:hypothetical protein LX24_02982 [Desulfallas thermosapovorans DSM 6562]